MQRRIHGRQSGVWDSIAGAICSTAASREPTSQAVLETDVFLDLRHIAGSLDTSAANATLLSGSESPRLLHGLAAAAISFRIPLGLWGACAAMRST